MTILQNFQKSGGLIPAIIQDEKTGAVLMLAYLNQEALEKTRETDLVTLWSRTRQKIWIKGEGSGNKLKVKSIVTDCDGDAILIKVEMVGKAACHTGSYSCFFNDLSKGAP